MKNPLKILQAIGYILLYFIVPFCLFGIILLLQLSLISLKPIFLLIIVILIVSAMAAFFAYAISRKPSPRFRVLGIVIGYAIIVMIFSTIYQVLFINQPTNFKIDFKKAFYENQLKNQLERLQELYTEQYYFQILIANSNIVLAANESRDEIKIDSLLTIDFDLQIVPMGPGYISFSVAGDDDSFYYSTQVGNVHDFWLVNVLRAQNFEETRLALQQKIKYNDGLVSVLHDEIKKTMKDGAALNYVDFIFFSASKVSLGSFETIKPDDRFIQGLTITQSLLGLIWIGFGLALLWPTKK